MTRHRAAPASLPPQTQLGRAEQPKQMPMSQRLPLHHLTLAQLRSCHNQPSPSEGVASNPSGLPHQHAEACSPPEPSRHLKLASPPATTRPGGAWVHHNEEPSLESSHHHHGWDEDDEQLKPEHQLHQSHSVNQKEPCAPVVTAEVQSSPTLGSSPLASPDHDQPLAMTRGGWQASVAMVVVQIDALNLSQVKSPGREPCRQADGRRGSGAVYPSIPSAKGQPANLLPKLDGPAARLRKEERRRTTTGAGQGGRAGGAGSAAPAHRRCASVTAC